MTISGISASGPAAPWLRACLLAAIGSGSLASGDIFYSTMLGADEEGVGEYGDPFVALDLGEGQVTAAWLDIGSMGVVDPTDGGTGDPGPDTGTFFPKVKAWSGPFVSQLAGSTAQIVKLVNGDEDRSGPVRLTESLYFGGLETARNNFCGTLGVGDEHPVAGLRTLVLQIQIAEAWGYDFYDHEMPVLDYTTSAGTVTLLPATFTANILKFQKGTLPVPNNDNGTIGDGDTTDEPVYVNLWGLQWDLSGVPEDIVSFQITFSGAQHAQVYGLRLDQSAQTHGKNLWAEPTGRFAAWIAGYDTAGQDGFDDDADADGVPNGLEFVLGANPTLAGDAELPRLETTAQGNWQFRFRRAAQAREGCKLAVEWSGDLVHWPAEQRLQIGPDTAASAPGVEVLPGEEFDTITVAAPPGWTRIFARLAVKLP